MFYLYTGLPGSFKTQSMIKFVNESEQFKNRPIYYYGIPGLKLDWIELTLEQLKLWYELPDGSVIVVDELQKVMPQRTKGDVPEFIKPFDEHRHQGHDFLAATQDPMLIDVAARRFVGKHRHHDRSFGMASAKVVEWEKCKTKTDDFLTRREGVVSRIKDDKKYHDLYISASIHNVKKKLPLKIFVPIVLGIVSFSCFAFLGVRLFDRTTPDEPLQQINTAPLSYLNESTTLQNQNTEIIYSNDIGYTEMHIPRIADLPWSAPIYDDLIEPKSFPKPNCIKFESGKKKGLCQCYSQQATIIKVSLQACLNFVKYGYFDFTIADEDFKGGQSSRTPAVAARDSDNSKAALLIKHEE